MIIYGFCHEKNQFTGHTIQQDYVKNNCHILKFYVNEKFVGVDIAGISANNLFYFKAKGKQVKLNQFFIDRYVTPCENSMEIIQHLQNQ
jgi:hypothetical protein